MIWRLNQEIGGLGVAHRLPLARRSAKGKCELGLPGEKEGQRRAGEKKTLWMVLLFIHLLVEEAQPEPNSSWAEIPLGMQRFLLWFDESARFLARVYLSKPRPFFFPPVKCFPIN